MCVFLSYTVMGLAFRITRSFFAHSFHLISSLPLFPAPFLSNSIALIVRYFSTPCTKNVSNISPLWSKLFYPLMPFFVGSFPCLTRAENPHWCCSVSLPNPWTQSHKSSFILRASNLLNVSLPLPKWKYLILSPALLSLSLFPLFGGLW